MDVHQHHVDGHLAQHPQGLGAVAGRDHRGADGFQDGPRHRLVDDIVVGDQHPNPAEVGGGPGLVGRRLLGRLGQGQIDGEPEGRAGAGPALEGDVAVHQARQLLADRQAQARAAELAGRRGVGLGEDLEQLRLLLLADPETGVRHRELQRRDLQGLAQRADLDPHLAFLGELQAVGNQVGQDLAQAGRVAADPVRRRRVDLQVEKDALGAGRLAPQLADVLAEVVKVEGDDLEFQPARLDLRDVEQVVEDGHQAAARADQHVHVAGLALVQPGLAQRVGHPQDAAHRRAELVAHHRQEGGLGLVGRHGALGLLLQIGPRAAQGVGMGHGLEQRRTHLDRPESEADGQRQQPDAMEAPEQRGQDHFGNDWDEPAGERRQHRLEAVAEGHPDDGGQGRDGDDLVEALSGVPVEDRVHRPGERHQHHHGEEEDAVARPDGVALARKGEGREQLNAEDADQPGKARRPAEIGDHQRADDRGDRDP